VGLRCHICGEASFGQIIGKSSYQTTISCSFGIVVKLTVVNNVETIASMPWIVTISGDDYANIGMVDLQGTKLISASGNKNPGVYEIELGLSVDEFMNSDEYLGGWVLLDH
jgi:NADH:ubiquinone oxidoreductase subunit F (NADH-binding)